MVSTGLNLFQLTTPTPSAPTMNVANDTSTDTTGGRKFARMLEESSSDQKPRSRQQSNDSRDTIKSSTPIERKARTKDTDKDDALEDRIDLDEEVSVDEAQNLLDTLDTLDPTTFDAASFDALKDQLQTIVLTQTPKSVSDIVTALKDVGSIQSLSGIVALLNVEQEVPQQEVAPELTVDSSDIVLPGNFFRSHLPKFSAKASKEKEIQPEQAAEAATTVVQITPLAQQLVIPQTTQAEPAPPITSVTVSADGDDLTITENGKRPDLDTLVPPLTRPKQETAKDTTLPDITLPTTAPDKKTAAFVKQLESAVGTTTQAPATDAKDAIPTHVQVQPKENPTPASLPSTAYVPQPAQTQAVLPGTVAKEQIIGEQQPIEKQKTTTSTDSILNPIGTIGAPQSTSGVTAISSSTNQNHAPIKEQVLVAIRQASKDGIDEITIQLDPGDLGRVEVKMHTNADGKTHIAFLADKPETFDALSRDARLLERSLQESGIKADTGSMQFNLRQQNQQQPGLHGDQEGSRHQNQSSGNASKEASTANTQPTPVAAARTYRLDVREGIDIHA